MLGAIIPVFLIILLGVAIRRFGWMPPDFFPSMEKFSFYVAFPAMMFVAIVRLEIDGTVVGQLALAAWGATAIMVLLTLLALKAYRSLPDPSRSSVFQGAIRPNTYFGIAVSSLMFEQQVVSLVVLALALCMPVVNVLAVVALSWWSGQRLGIGRLLLAIVRNPIIVSTVAAGAWNGFGLPVPQPLVNTLDIIGRAALCLGLVCVGGGLIFSREGMRPLAVGLTSVLKLLVMPLAGALLCAAFSLPSPMVLAACFYCSLPTAPNAYIMARQMGGDARLMATIITAQTLLAVVTVPICMAVLARFGY